MMSPSLNDGLPLSFSALILCAGRSSRMGAFKPLLPLEGQTVIERVIGLFRGAGIADITVVLGHRAESIAPLLERHRVRLTVNDRYDEGMLSSVKTGVAQIDRNQRAFFLLPADIPLVKRETLTALISAFREGEIDLCRPCFRGRHGHPPLISSALIPAILDFTGPGGLRAFLSRCSERTVEVAVEDPGILMDLDTGDDYDAALKMLGDIDGQGYVIHRVKRSPSL
jgi:molybdenum cofactor cytidylyltransferase